MKTPAIFSSVTRILTLIFTLALTHTLTLHSQPHKYIPFPDSNAIWVIKQVDEFGEFQLGYQYFIENDTIINGITYHKVYRAKDSMLLDKHWNWKGLRNDTAARKVFMFDIGSGLEYLLYDLSLHEGDTIDGNCWQYGGRVIDNIDTIQLHGRDHLIFYINGYAPYIEGVGSVAGLFEKAYFFEGGYELVCLMKGKDRIPYFTYLPNTCELYHWTGVDVVTETISEITVYPNPINRMSVIGLYDGSDVIENLIVFDLTGKRVVEIHALRQNNYPIGFEINRSGMYFYRIETRSGKIFTGKLIR